MGFEKPESNKELQEKRYFEKETINGIEIEVGWDNGYGDYTIYLPQIEIIGGEAEKRGISDQVLRISENPELAKKVFEFAKGAATQEKDAYDLYNRVEKFIKSLPEE